MTSEDENEETQENLEKAMLQENGTCGQRCPEVEITTTTVTNGFID